MFDDDVCFAYVVQAKNEGGLVAANPPVRASQETMALCDTRPSRVMDTVKYFLHDKFYSHSSSVAATPAIDGPSSVRRSNRATKRPLDKSSEVCVCESECVSASVLCV